MKALHSLTPQTTFGWWKYTNDPATHLLIKHPSAAGYDWRCCISPRLNGYYPTTDITNRHWKLAGPRSKLRCPDCERP